MQHVPVVELEAHARVRRLLRRVEQQRAGHPQVHEQVPVAVELPDQILAATPELARSARRSARRRSAPAGPAGSSGSRGSRRARACAPRDAGASWRRIVSTSGSSGIDAPIIGTESPEARRPRRPVSHFSTLAPTSAIGPSWRRGRGARPRPPAAARTRGCGRCGRPVGSTPWSAVRTSRSSGRRRSSQPPTCASISSSAPTKPWHVVAVAVDLVGLDQVREHEPVLERLDQRVGLGERDRVGRARMLLVDAAPDEQLAGLADAVDRDAGRRAARRGRTRLGGCEREVLAPVGPRRSRPARPGTAGRSRARPRARPAARAARARRSRQLVGRDDRLVRGDLQHRVLARVDDQGARLADCSAP